MSQPVAKLVVALSLAFLGSVCQAPQDEGFESGFQVAEASIIAAAGGLATPAPLRGPDDPWRLEVLAHPHGPRVLKARIVAPDEQPIAELAVAEGGGGGPRRAWRDTVAAAHWLVDGCDPGGFRDPSDSPWVIMALLPALSVHPEAVEWLGELEQCIAWAFLESLQPMTSA